MKVSRQSRIREVAAELRWSKAIVEDINRATGLVGKQQERTRCIHIDGDAGIGGLCCRVIDYGYRCGECRIPGGNGAIQSGENELRCLSIPWNLEIGCVSIEDNACRLPMWRSRHDRWHSDGELLIALCIIDERETAAGRVNPECLADGNAPGIQKICIGLHCRNRTIGNYVGLYIGTCLRKRAK